MTKPTLTISSKNYSSWSLAKFAKLEFEEVPVPPDDVDARKELLLLSPSILVPCLTHDGIKVHRRARHGVLEPVTRNTACLRAHDLESDIRAFDDVSPLNAMSNDIQRNPEAARGRRAFPGRRDYVLPDYRRGLHAPSRSRDRSATLAARSGLKKRNAMLRPHPRPAAQSPRPA